MTFWTTVTAKTALAGAGLALMGGLAAAPASAAVAPASVAPARTAVASVHTDTGGKHTPSTDALARDLQGKQQRFTPDREQLDNARAIVKAAKDLHLSDRAAVIAVATSLQESKLQNLGHLGDRNDHDSLGLFQQRPSSGWGTAEQITDPDHSAKAFYQGLKQVDGWQDMPLTEAAQTVQVSAYPDAYAKWEKMAADLVLASHDSGPYANKH